MARRIARVRSTSSWRNISVDPKLLEQVAAAHHRVYSRELFRAYDGSFRIPVLAEFEPERIKITGATDFDTTIGQLVDKGLCASLASGNLLFGKLLISLDLHPDEAAVQADTSGPYPVIPTIRGTFGEIAHDALAQLEELRHPAGTLGDSPRHRRCDCRGQLQTNRARPCGDRGR